MAWRAQRRLKTVEQSEIVLTVAPAWHGTELKPAGHLIGRVDVIMHGNLTDQHRRNIVTSAEPAQKCKNRLDVAASAAQRIVKLVEDQHPGRQLAQQRLQFCFADNVANRSERRLQRV